MNKTTIQHSKFYVHKQYLIYKTNCKIKSLKRKIYINANYTNAERRLGMINKAVIVCNNRRSILQEMTYVR